MKILSLIALLFVASSAYSKPTSWTGKVVNKKGELVYTEVQEAKYKDGQMTELKSSYKKPDGTDIGYIKSDFTRKPFVPIYDTKDYRFKTEEGLYWKDDQLMMFHQKQGKERKDKPYNFRESLVSGQGLHKFLMANYDELLKGKVFKVDFLLPARFDAYGFRIKMIPSKNKNHVRFRAEFRSWFMRLVAPHLEVAYDKTNKNLMEFTGPSNVLDDAGNTQDVVITYTYK